MSDINDIFERLKGQKPVISNPDELTDLIMDSLPDISEATEPTGARVVKMRWWMAAAASLIIIIGIGTIWMFDNEQPKPQKLTAHHSVVTATPKVVVDLKSTTKEYGDLKSPVTKTSGDLKTSVNTKVKTEEDKTEKQSHTAVISNLHYAVCTPEEDSVCVPWVATTVPLSAWPTSLRTIKNSTSLADCCRLPVGTRVRHLATC